MAGGPAETLAGVSMIGMAALLGYSAYKDVPLFGPNGLVTEAIHSGKLPTGPASTTATPTAPKTSTSPGKESAQAHQGVQGG